MSTTRFNKGDRVRYTVYSRAVQRALDARSKWLRGPERDRAEKALRAIREDIATVLDCGVNSVGAAVATISWDKGAKEHQLFASELESV